MVPLRLLSGLSSALLFLLSAGTITAQAALMVLPVGAFSMDSTGRPELSGLTWAGGTQYYAVGDNGATSIYDLGISLNHASGAIISASIDSSISAPSMGTDSEGIAYNGANASAYVSDEVAAGITEFRLSDGVQIGSVTVPSIFSNHQGNRSLESLSLQSGGSRLWTANEEALSPDALSTTGNGTWVRLQRFDASRNADGQWAYLTDSISADSPFTTAERSGVSDILALPSGDLLVLERELGGAFIPDFRIRLYLASFDGVTDVSGLNSLDGGGFTGVSKSLLWQGDFSASIDNFEGITLGPTLDNGNASILLIADNSSSGNTTRLYSLQLSGDWEAAAVPEPAILVLVFLGGLLLRRAGMSRRGQALHLALALLRAAERAPERN